MTVRRITNARLLGETGLAPRAGLWTLRLASGRIMAVERSDGGDEAAHPNAAGPSVRVSIRAPQTTLEKAEDGEAIDAAGALVMPALVDPHLHLDLAYSAEIVPANKSGTLLEAIELWARAKAELSSADVLERALRAIGDEIAGGAGHIRSHCDVGSAAGLRLAEGVLQARQATAALCDIQLVAFPQDGLLRDRPALDLVVAACKAGVDLVGGIPHIERTPREGIRHLEMVFELAEKLDRDIDVHIDETDDPTSCYTEHLASLTIERGWQGRVTASHVCALSGYSDVHAARVIDLLAEARIRVVTNPGVNLHLQGRFDRYPKRRGLTRISELLARGVACAAGQDCISDPFYPLGNGQMLDQAFLLVHADHMNTPERMRAALEMVSGMAAMVINRPSYGVRPGGAAHLAIFDATDALELIRLRPRPMCVLHGGDVVAGAAPAAAGAA